MSDFATNTNKPRENEEPSSSSSQEEDYEEYGEAEAVDLEIKELRVLIKNSAKLYKKISEFLQIAATKIKAGKHKEALLFLQQSEKILEFAASSGCKLDRNLIIVVLYDSACAYQGLWQLDKCSKYLDGVIYNIESCLKEDEQIFQALKASPRFSDYKANRIKKLKFLILCNLQYSAILSQVSQHQKSLENAKKTWGFLVEMFQECFEYVKELKRYHENANISRNFLTNPHKTNQNFDKNSGSPRNFLTNPTKSKVTNKKTPKNTLVSSLNDSKSSESKTSSKKQGNFDAFGTHSTMGIIRNEVPFSKIVLDYAWPILEFMSKFHTYEEISSKGQEMICEVRKSLYFWKNNPENNEKYLRKELKSPLESDDDSRRSLLGVADSTEWLENFNIGSLMHMNAISYEEFMFYGEIIYEVSKKLLLEKVIYFSVVLFTMATEIRFIEIERRKNANGFDTAEGKEPGIGMMTSEVFHLKAIEIACKCISCNCPYINHLITSYHKHYNQSLEIIPEESFISSAIDQKHSSPKQQDSSTSEFYPQNPHKTSQNLCSEEKKSTNTSNNPNNLNSNSDNGNNINNNAESSLTSLMTNSPKIKKLLHELKRKNVLKGSKKKPCNFELDPLQQSLLKALNENLKKNLQEKKVVNIRNSYKFVLGVDHENLAKSTAKNKEKLKQINVSQPTKSRYKNIEHLLKNKLLPQDSSTPPTKTEAFKPLSARTHAETSRIPNILVKSLEKTSQPIEITLTSSTKSLKNKPKTDKTSKNPLFSKVPKLNLEILKRGQLEDVRFFTPRGLKHY